MVVSSRSIESKKNNTMEMTSSGLIELEVEPGLAERLDGLGSSKLGGKVSILWVWFARDGHSILVKADILQQYVTRFKQGFGGQPIGDVEYQTLTVTPVDSTLQKAPDEDWEQAGRMVHFSNNFKNRVKAYRNRLQDREFAAINSTMSNAFASMMKATAAQQAANGQFLRSIGR